ncbi:uncharacterized protein A4U43_C09F4650 [Asparagus officinalis]|uniref:Uncharacterized protein n=1 Tax=Asparagus officinalis TaxID=4686 RepID=A0A5P1E5B2_ASPOF|nr:uncharacterized protein A4U43_C09F4650 [Asparagus officinalis]
MEIKQVSNLLTTHNVTPVHWTGVINLELTVYRTEDKDLSDNKVKSGSPVVDFWRPVVDSDEKSPSTVTAELEELLLASPLKARFCADFDDGGAGG